MLLSVSKLKIESHCSLALPKSAKGRAVIPPKDPS